MASQHQKDQVGSGPSGRLRQRLAACGPHGRAPWLAPKTRAGWQAGVSLPEQTPKKAGFRPRKAACHPLLSVARWSARCRPGDHHAGTLVQRRTLDQPIAGCCLRRFQEIVWATFLAASFGVRCSAPLAFFCFPAAQAKEKEETSKERKRCRAPHSKGRRHPGPAFSLKPPQRAGCEGS